MTAVIGRIARVAVLVLCVAWTGSFLAQKITLTTADIGRHLKNGQVFAEYLAHSFDSTHDRPSDGDKAAILTTNFYSYTHRDFKALNHHWGSGLVFHGIHRVFGFEGLGFFQLALLLAAWTLMILLAVRRGGWGWAMVWALWLVPVFAARREIRPEAFSIFFSACFIYFFERYADRKISGRILAIVLVALQILWTNLHIYFVLGPLITAVYAASYFFERESRVYGRFPPKSAADPPSAGATLMKIFACTAAVTIINPFGIRGALYPFFIFGDYGYRLVENQSIPFLEQLRVVMPTFLFFKTASIALFCAVILHILVRRRAPQPLTLLAVLFAVAGWRAIRNFQLFALFALPVLAAGFAAFTDFRGLVRWTRNAVMVLCASAAVASTLLIYRGLPWRDSPGFGVGLSSGSEASVEFFREEALKGPIFNNYDIGGYLIYELWPSEKVFVDNRPEAYPGAFFKDILIPAQEDEAKWRELDGEYHFNVIFFSYHDLTPWAQGFMARRLDDPEWAPVFADAYAIIFLRRTVENSSVLVRRQLPRSMFRVTER